MLQSTVLVFLIFVTVTKEFPMNIYVQSIAEGNNIDGSDNYIPRYDDFPSYNHPTLNHMKNENRSYFNSTTDDASNTENNEETSTPFFISVVTNNQGMPTIELEAGKNDAGKNDQNGEITNDSDNVKNENKYSQDSNEMSLRVTTSSVVSTDKETTTASNEIDDSNNIIDTTLFEGSVTQDSETNIDNLINTPIEADDDNSNTNDEVEINTTLPATTTTLTSTSTSSTTIISYSRDSVEVDLATTEKINDVTEANKLSNPENISKNNDNGSKNNEHEDSSPVVPLTEKPKITEINNTFNISEVDSPSNETTRNPREEDKNDDDDDQDNSSSSEEDEEEEEDSNMVTGLLSALLGGLSRPDGSIDLEAIVGLIGSLSTQNDDGTYDFQGLTELLKGFFGGGDGGGGSDIGAFTGGLLGAIIKGIANPPGGKGVGTLTAKILAGILPALSVQPPDPDMQSDGKPSLVKPGGLDIGGFLGGFLKTLFGASNNINPVKFLVSTITSLSNSKPMQPKGNYTH